MKRIPTEADLTPGAPVPDEAPDWSRTDEIGSDKTKMLELADKIEAVSTVGAYIMESREAEMIVNVLRAAARPTLVELERAEARAKA